MKKVLAIVLSVLICVFSISCSSRAKKSDAADSEKTGKEATFNSRPDVPQQEEQIDFDKRHTLTFSLLNRTGIGIYEVYTKNTSDSVWGENQLNNVLNDGKEINGLTYEVSLSSVYFSIKIADKEGNALVFDRLDMSYSTEDPVVILTYTPQYDGSGNLDALSGYRAYGVDSSKKDTEDEKLSKVSFPGFEADGMSEEEYDHWNDDSYWEEQESPDENQDEFDTDLNDTEYEEPYMDEEDEYQYDDMGLDIPEDAVTKDGHSYFVFNIKDENLSDYWDVEDFCEELGGHLAVIDSDNENEFLFNYMLVGILLRKTEDEVMTSHLPGAAVLLP